MRKQFEEDKTFLFQNIESVAGVTRSLFCTSVANAFRSLDFLSVFSFHLDQTENLDGVIQFYQTFIELHLKAGKLGPELQQAVNTWKLYVDTNFLALSNPNPELDPLIQSLQAQHNNPTALGLKDAAPFKEPKHIAKVMAIHMVEQVINQILRNVQEIERRATKEDKDFQSVLMFAPNKQPSREDLSRRHVYLERTADHLEQQEKKLLNFQAIAE